MKKWNRFLGSLALSAALLLTSVLPAFAEEAPEMDIATQEQTLVSLAVPDQLTATVFGSSVQLNWQAPTSESLVFYTVAEKKDGKISDLELPENFHGTSYEVQGLDPATYEFTVRAYALDNGSPLFSEYTAPVSVTVTATMKTVRMSSKYTTVGIGETVAATSGSGLLAEWVSSDPAVATVDHKGRITAKKAGQTLISAKSSALFAKSSVSCLVTVKDAPTEVSLPKSLEVGVNDPTVIHPNFGGKQAGGQVSYTVADPKIALVSTDGTLLPLQLGNTELTAKTFNGLEASTTLKVKKAPTSVEFRKESYTLGEGEEISLSPKLSKDSAANYTFSSSDNEIIQCQRDGTLTGIRSGDAVLTVTTYNGLTAECTVSVKQAPESMTLDQGEITLGLGSTHTLSPTLSEDSASHKISYQSSDDGVATVSEDGTITAKGSGTATVTASTYNGKSASIVVEVNKVKNYDKMLALTFDDGPYRPTTTKLLDALKERDIKATFFMVGNRVGDAPDLVQRMLDEGHELGNHSWDHSTLTAGNTKDQIGRTDEALIKASGQASTVFRSPYGSYDNDVMKQANKPQMYWSVDTEDWKNKNAEYVKNYIISHASDGAIVLTHDIHETSVDGVIAALDTLLAEGYTMVTTSDLIARNGTPPTAGNTYFSEAKK